MKGFPPPTTSLRWIDYTAMLVYFSFVLGIGVAAARRSRLGRCVAETAALAGRAARTAVSPRALRRGGTARSGALRPLRGSHARSSRGVPPLLTPEGPTADTNAVDPLEFVGRVR